MSSGQTRVPHKIARASAYCLYLGLTTLLLLLLAELALRALFGLPRGLFYFTPLKNTSLYRPNAKMNVVIMPLPYTIETNALGFRGGPISREKPAGITRIIALGDSITDGYMVDNPDTYPQQLQDLLRNGGHNVEVVNAARGYATIDREYAILRKFCMPLDPDLVLLTFCGNDLYEMRSKSREELVSLNIEDMEPDAASEWLLFARTALGEAILDAVLRYRHDRYRAHQRYFAGLNAANRYDVPGAADYERNIELARKSSRSYGIGDPELLPVMRARLDDYLYALSHMNRFCAERSVRLMFVYFPTYEQIYDPAASMQLRDVLRAKTSELAIPFIDATLAYRARGRAKPLFLMPLDFHPNPEGNRVLAEAVRDALISQDFGFDDRKSPPLQSEAAARWRSWVETHQAAK